ncbi:MAG TPA: glycosyltransferase [Alphaproteobacteria bacterium]|nr:glycosyltransferase [Alphaproteobacteria bacterium]
MRVLLVHEKYRLRGGEDVAVEAEESLLAAGGVEVATLIEDNTRIEGGGSLSLALRSIWSREGYRAVSEAIASHRPDIVNIHNTFPLLSPSVYYAARAQGIPVVQTLHNFRLLCTNGFLLRDGRVCGDCIGRTMKWPAVKHACYRSSRPASAAVAAIVGSHHLAGTWRRRVDLYLALNPLSRDLFIQGGLPPDRVDVCPPPVRDPGPGPAANHERKGALFVGRLSPEKGLETLIEAWRGVEIPLDIVGEGPLADSLIQRAPPQVRFRGPLPPSEVSAAMTHAAFLVFPSLWYENFPLVVAEAMAHGLPVLASSEGAPSHMLEDGVTGAFARPGDSADWRRNAMALAAQAGDLRRLGTSARRCFETRYASGPALERRLRLYGSLLGGRLGSAPR